MAVINTITDQSNGCDGSSINTGQLGCDVPFGLVIHGIGVKKSFSIPEGTDVDLDYINALVQAGEAIPVMNAFSSEPEIADDTFETSPLGVEALTLRGLPKYMLTMKEGQYYYKEMAKLTGFGNLNWILGDVKGAWKFAVNSDGSLTGFTAGQTTAMMTVPATASETEKKSVVFQLTDRNQIDSSYLVVLASSLFPISDVKGVNGVNFTFEDANGLVPPADGETTLKVKAVLSNGNSGGIEGMEVADFLYVNNGATIVVTGVVDDGNGFYTLTVPALSSSDIISLETFDGSVNKNVIILGDNLYRSNVLTATVV